VKLVRAELSRLAARRFIQLMVVLLIAAFGITIATTIASSHQPTVSELARAEAQADRQRTEAQRWYSDCLRAQLSESPDVRERYPADCQEVSPRRINSTDFLYGVFVFEREIRGLMYFLVAFLALFGFLVGASYIGADLTSGGMTNLLLWRPQRMTVLGAKLGTLIGSVLALSAVASVVYLGAFWTIAQVGGLPGDLDAEFWRWLGLTAGRGLSLTLLATALGFSIATLGRHTAAALGVVAGYAIVWEIGARIVMHIVEVARPDQWMLSTYLGAWLIGEVELWDRSGCRGDFSGFCDASYTLTWVHALIVLLVVVGAFVVGAFVNFQRRDLA
jgi:ABC-2 type transport system permease protein